MTTRKKSKPAGKKPAARKPTKRKKPPKKRETISPASGRPTKFNKDYCRQAEKLCKLSATDKEMADFFGVAKSTLDLWKLKHPEFSDSIKSGKEIADANVAERLYQRAMGYSHEEEKIFCTLGEVTRADCIKHYAPDTTAAIFWLKNRQPGKWRDKKEVTEEKTVKIEVSIVDEFVSRIASIAARSRAGEADQLLN